MRRPGSKAVLVVTLLAAMAGVAGPALAASATRDGEIMPFQYLYLREYSKLRHEAELGNPEAQFQLGVLHYDPPGGSSVTQSYRRAFLLFYEAAMHGHATAQHNVGAMYWNGDYVAQNVVEGYAWFLLSANQGDAAGARKQKLYWPDLSEIQRSEAQERSLQLQQQLVNAQANREYAPKYYGIQ